MIIIYIAGEILCNVGMVISYTVDTSSWLYKLGTYGMTLIHMGITFSIATTLKWHRENRWRVFAMYVLLAEEVIVYAAGIVLTNSDVKTLGYFYGGVLILNVFFCFYVLVSSLMVKHRAIATYFKIYGSCLFAGMLGVVAIEFLYVYIRFPRYIFGLSSTVFFLMHTIPLLVMYINLNNKNFKYRVGDLVMTKTGLENLPARTRGTIIAKHGDDYEAEFFDGRENLLATLKVSATDIEFALEPDLQARVNAFGK